MTDITPPGGKIIPLITLAWNQSTWGFDATLSIWLLVLLAIAAITLLFLRWKTGRFPTRDFEIDQAEIGIGSHKVSFRPNLADRQIAYAIWVELSTRKIGLEIDFEHDVLIEIYDSWYSFFKVTRELIKGVPVAKLRSDSTQQIIQLSIEVLNMGLRPHLTRWQARFRKWYEREVKRYDNAAGTEVLDPQQIQQKFPQYEDLRKDMHRVNQFLIHYRAKMRELIFTES